MNKQDDKSEIFKLSKKDRNILIKIDKSNKWKDVKGIDDIDNELQDLDIYDDFIGLGCSKYLNEAGQNGNLNVDEMFRNCREAEKVRVRIKKKQRKEKASKARKGGKGNIGSLLKTNKETPKDIDSKQIKEENPIITKAKKIGDKIKDVLNKSIKGGDWKDNILKLGLSLGMDTLFGIVIGVMEYTIDNPIGGIALTSSMIGLIGGIYAYISETEMGQKVIGNITKWINGKMNELYDYLMGEDIKVLKKKPKKKPFDRGGGGGSKKDDDDDDDDDDGGDGYIVDTVELNKNTEETTEETTEENEIKETPPQQQQQQPQSQGELVNTLLGLYQSHSIAQAQQLQNANLERLFTQNVNNPITTPPITTPPITEPPITTPPQTETTEPIIPTETPVDTSSYSTYLGGAVAGILGGVSMISSNILGSVPVQEGDMLLGGLRTQQPTQGFSTYNTPRQFRNDMNLRTPTPNNNAESLLAPRSNTESLLPSRGSIQPRYNTQQSSTQTESLLKPKQTQTTETSQDTIDAQNEISDYENKLKAEREKNKEFENKINSAIDDIELRGQAYGLIGLGAPSGKVRTVGIGALNSLIAGINVIEQQARSLYETRQEETGNLLNDVEIQAQETFKTITKMDEENERLQQEVNQLKLDKRQQVIQQQEMIEEEIRAEQDIKKFVERTETETESSPRRVEIEPDEDTNYTTADTPSADTASASISILGVGRQPNQDIVLIQERMGLPRQTGFLPSGARRSNEVLFSVFLLPKDKKNPEKNRRRTNVLRNVNNEDREAIFNIVLTSSNTATGTTRAKITPTEAKQIADILRKY